MIEEVELNTCHIFINSKKYCVISVKQMATGVITLKDANETCKAIYEICKGKRTPLIFDLTKFQGQFEQGVRSIFRNHEKLALVKLVSVVITSSLGNKLMVNFYIKFNKPLTPMRIFSEEKDAIKWIEKELIQLKTCG